MPNKLGVPIGGWKRFEKYVILNGYIYPVPNAELTWYSPWDLYDKDRDDPPYKSLLNLADKINLNPNTSLKIHALTPENERDILNWCGKYGHLGILPHRTQMLTLHPRWEPLPPESKDPKRRNMLYASQYTYFRTNIGWSGSYSQYFGRDVYYLIDEPEKSGDPVEEQYLPKGSQKSGAFLRDLDRFNIKFEELSKTWALFFPSVPTEKQNIHQYPTPGTDEFWNQYVEPTRHFILGAKALRNAVDLLQSIKPLKDRTDEDKNNIFRGMTLLHCLIAPAQLALTPTDEGGFSQHWVTTSLLSSLATMVLQDLTGGRRLLRCETCGTLYLTDAYQSRYCSDKCRHTAQKRRYRQRLKEKEEI